MLANEILLGTREEVDSFDEMTIFSREEKKKRRKKHCF